MELDSKDNDTLLDQSQHEIFVQFLPVIVVMAVASFVGILGNIFTIVFYALKCKRTTFTVQIACLASADLLVCCMIIPHVIEAVVNVKHNERILCKLTKFFGMWTISSSCLILWIIALNRHRRICNPFAKQLMVKTTVRCVVGSVIFSFFLSVRNFANFDIITVNVPVSGINETVRGLYCTTRDDAGYKISAFVFHLIDFILVLMILITIIVCYSRIICTLITLKRTDLKKGPSERERLDLPEANGEGDMPELSYELSTLDTLTTDLKCLDDTAVSSENTLANISEPIQTVSGGIDSNNRSGETVITRKRTQQRKMPARSPSERNLTFMMFTVSFLFVLCFFPYFVVKIIMRLGMKSGEEFELSVGIQFALRLVYFNSVVNPIVYCIFNPQFRQYIKDVFLKCLRCRLKS